MLHNSSSAIGLLSGAGKRANMPLTSRSLAAVFLIDNFLGLQMWLQSASARPPPVALLPGQSTHLMCPQGRPKD
eukprot:14285818-Ditylum_brightwellii.AAC.1